MSVLQATHCLRGQPARQAWHMIEPITMLKPEDKTF